MKARRGQCGKKAKRFVVKDGELYYIHPRQNKARS